MLIETRFEEYSNDMVQSMTFFSGDVHAAEDAVQCAFMKALVNRAMLEQMPEPAMKAWLYATARNAVIDMKRKQSRLVYMIDENLVYHQMDPTDRMIVDTLVSSLPPYLQKPVSLKYFSQLNATEIGRILGLPPPTVRTRVRVAIGLMRGMMKGDFTTW